MTSSVPSFFRLHSQLASGQRACTSPPISLTAFLPLLAPLPHLTTLFSVPLRGMTTFVSSGVRVTLTPRPLLRTSCLPDPLSVSSLGTPRTTRGTAATISPLVASSSHAHVVFDESVFPFSTTNTPSTSGLDLYSLPTDAVVEPPLPLFPAGSTAPYPGSPSASASPDPAPRSSRDGDPSGPAPVTPTNKGPRPSPLAPIARFARPILVYQRRWPLLHRRHQRSCLPLRQGHRGHRRSPNLLASSNRCITRRSFTSTRVMFILW
jgi:hypothetical protein